MMLVRYPNTKLDAPELTLEAWIGDTAYLPLDELRQCIDYAVANDSSGFVPTSGKIIDAFIKRRTDGISGGGIGNPCTAEELRLTAAHRARGYLRELREKYIDDRLQLGQASDLVDGLIGSMGRKRLTESTP